MNHLVRSIVLDSPIGQRTRLASAGSSLENPYVYDSVARDLEELARDGLVEILEVTLRKDVNEPLVGAIAFKRLR
ncbi:MAG TPA: hypothetical protein VMU47_01480 [Caldimonas sp.]|nr:hypothetical protein [Caldimonas sp.]